MKPLKLVFSGLHSYRQEQEIDFRELAGYGLFGIFGPTGAGKSTILDAITLALFGNVERAERGRRGILNQQENQLRVAFTFELGEQVYRVERQYVRERTDPFAVRARNARLVQLNPDGTVREVLASSPSEVDEHIVKILGLRKEDFTRAVVLPQGKFDEFLKLTGGERARMLEYIFCLERYGDELAEKAKRVLEDCEQRLSQIAAEEAAMGDASVEALARARREVDEQEAKVQAMEKEVEAWRAQWQQMEEDRRLYERLEEVRARRAALEEQLPAVEEHRRALELAARAEPLRQDLEREERLAEDLKSLRETLVRAKALEQQAEGAWATCRRQLEEVEKRREREWPRWQERFALVKGAVEREAERRILLEELQKQEVKLRELSRQIRQLNLELEKKRSSLKALQERQKEVGACLQSLSVDPEEKERLAEAAKVLTLLEDRERQALGWEQKYREQQRRWEEKQHILLRFLQQRLPGVALGPETDVAGVIEGAVREVEERASSLRRSLEQAWRVQKAASLAAGLRAGEPCPVCGSREHPCPAKGEDLSRSLEDLAREQEAAEKELWEARRWRDEAFRIKSEWEALGRTLVEGIAPERERVRQEVGELTALFRQASGGLGRDGVRTRLEEIRGAEQKLSALGGEMKKMAEEAEELEARIRELEGRLQGLTLKESTLKGEIATKRAQEGELRKKIEAAAGNEDPASLLRAIEEQMGQMEAEVTRLRRLEKKAQEELHEAQRKVAGLESRLKALEEEEKELKGSVEGRLAAAGFAGREEARTALMGEERRRALSAAVEDFQRRFYAAGEEIKYLEGELAGREFNPAEWERAKRRLEEGERELTAARSRFAVGQNELERLERNHRRWLELEKEKQQVAHRRELADLLRRLLSGRKLVEFLAEEQLRDMVLEASRRLGSLTGQRYALELDERGDFILRDDFNGGQRRPVSTLSGGETFLTSLCLALALSSQLQLKGRYPLGFFFLDEGFGTLDAAKLEVVMQALERLRRGACLVGVISHVRELQERMPVYLEVVPAGPEGKGSRVRLVHN
ncbi:AAA family ATPase [Thermanaeromonas sp. C210]|uniref:AAA family ATPase n=1 Tax=Thermanaeromonas sp. C210 TaxID=2731925 RepID=UPI00155C7C34|nr:SMC family ATPase [Thermanaeromonas sp. C210]GFN22327.1 nuclease SbcCD subunit C [Thermanaeromonas sp. C210]